MKTVWGRAPLVTAAASMIAALTLPMLIAPLASAATTWAAATAPTSGLGPSAAANPDVNFGKVVGGATTEPLTCPSAGSCVAVGNYVDSSGYLQGQIETLSGGTWTVATAPLTGLNPIANVNPNVYFYALSCPTTGSCVAVGSYADASYNQQGLIETLTGGIWTATTAPLGGLSPVASTDPTVSLTGLSCPAIDSCVAVGMYTDTSVSYDGLIEALAGGSWTATSAPLGGLSSAVTPRSLLLGVACSSTGSCVAGGQYQDNSNDYQGLIETLASGSWTATSAPLGGLSSAASTDPGGLLRSVSCPSTGSCVAVGQYNASSSTQGLIETLTGGIWTATTAPLGGLSPAAGSPPVDPLATLSCAATGSCVAVGMYTDASDNQQGLIETLTGGIWTATTAPLGGLSPAAGTDPAVTIGNQACTTTTSCVAVGSYTDTSGNQQGLIETLTGGIWTATTAPLGGLSPAAGTKPAESLVGLSCPGTGSCVAVGSYTDTSGNQQGLIESQSTSSLATCTWTDSNSATNNDWSNGGNWSGAGCTNAGGPPAGAALVFPSPVPNGATPQNDLTAGTVFDSLAIDGAYTLDGNQIALDPASGPGMSVSTTGTVTLSVPVVLGTSQTFSSSVGAAVELNSVLSDAGQGYVLTLSGPSWNMQPMTSTTPASNTYSGGTVISSNSSVNLRNPAALGSGPVTIESGSTLSMVGAMTIANHVTVSGNGDGGGGALVAMGADVVSGPVTLGSASSVVASGPNASLLLASGVDGTGALSTAGMVVLPHGQSATNTLGVAALGGILQVDGSVSGEVSATNATVNGSGSAGGIAMGCDSALSAGDAGPGVLTSTAGLSLSCASGPVSLGVAVDGPAPGDYSQISTSSGTVSLGGAELSVSFGNGFESAAHDVYDIVVNQGGVPVSGVFSYGGAPLPEGTTFVVAGRTLRISYAGGPSGHDVTLTDVTNALPPPPPPAPAPVTTPTATSLSSSSNSATIGEPIVVTATTSPAPNGGTVTFTNNGTVIEGCAPVTVDTSTGVATCTVTYSVAGSHTIDAAYSGDAAFRASSSPPLTETVNTHATTTLVSVSPTSTVAGRRVTLSATVATTAGAPGTPSGSIVFVAGTVSLCTAALTNATGTCTAPPMPVGADTITATYSGDAAYAGSSGTATVTVRPRNRAARPRAIDVMSPAWTGRTVVVTVVGWDFYGHPMITTNARDTRVEVLRDNGTRLTIQVTTGRLTPRGTHTMVIVFAHGERTTVRYLQR